METREQAIQRLRDLVLEGKNSPSAGVADKACFDRLRDFLRQDKWQRHSQFPVPDSIGDLVGDEETGPGSMAGTEDERWQDAAIGPWDTDRGN